MNRKSSIPETISATPPATERVLADVGDPRRGATLIAIGSVHGNEPAGAEALRRVRQRLAPHTEELRGRFLASAGHLEAIRRGERFIEHDLNRLWTPAAIDRILRAPESDRAPEERELAALHELIVGAVREASENPVYLIDLHTTSAHSAPFAVINDTLACRDLALRLPVPIILGLEEHVSGTLPDFALTRGCIALGFEAGQHDDPASIDNHEAAVFMALRAADILPPENPLGDGDHERRLRTAAQRLPRFVEIIQRHPITRREAFEVKPGFENFARVQRGQLIARDEGRELRAPRSALIFMPLYQDQGDDGYFLVRVVSPFWLWLSRRVRVLGLPSLVHWLPGVRRDSGDRRLILIDPRVARALRAKVLHLLGFRRFGARDGFEVYRRRD